MVINHNLGANNANRTMGVNQNNASKSMEKLSSGMRINRAADDAAGLAISEKMRGQIRGLDQASNNAQDGISLIQTAEGATSEIHSILQRMRELAVQSGSDTITASDRVEVQKETDQLAQEIGRVGNTTQFNTQKLIDGSFNNSFQIGANQDQSMAIKMSDMRSKALGISGDVTVNIAGATAVPVTEGTAESVGTNIAVGSYTVQYTKMDVADSNSNFNKYDLVDVTGSIVATSADGKMYTNVKDVSNTFQFADTASVTSGKIKIELNEAGDAKVAVADTLMKGDIATNTGLEVGTYRYNATTKALTDDGGNVVAIGDGTAFTSGIASDGATASTVLTLSQALDETNVVIKIHGVDVSSKSAANTAITTIQKAIETVSTQRSTLGSYQNRLEHTIANLGTSSENLTSAESRIRDVDMAKEMSTFSKNNILSQAAQAMLAQANQQPQQVLQLLR